MIENGMRLRVWATDTKIVVIETLRDKKIVYENNMYVCDELNHTEVIECLLGIEDLLLTNKQKKFWGIPKLGHETPGLYVCQYEHCNYSISLNGAHMRICDGVTHMPRKTQPEKIISELTRVISVLGKEGNRVLSPSTDTCRLVSSLDLFVIKSNGCKIILDSKNRCGNVLLNCLYNNVIFTWLYVDVHVDENKVYIFNSVLNEVTSLDLDESFLKYFVDDKNTFKEE